MTPALLALLLAAPPAADTWPQWRGPANDGHAPAARNIPAEWGPQKNIVWAKGMPGPGSSTPCVWGDSIFLTAMAGSTAVLLHLDAKTGDERWRTALGKAEIYTRGDEGGNIASASCSTDGKLVFAFAGTGKLAAFDYAGDEKWSHDLAARFGDPTDRKLIQFGGHWTPVLDHSTLYVAVQHRKAQKLLAFDAVTGKEKWSADRASDSRPGTESPDVYSSPFVWRNGDRAALVVHGNDYCTGHDLADGRELWRVTELNPKANYNRAWRAISSPLVTPDLIVVPSCKRGVTVALDPIKATGTIPPGGTGELWRLPKDTPDVPSPIRVGDRIYLMGETGTLTAVEAATGKVTFSERLTQQRHRANPVFADGKLILVGRDGTMPVVKPGAVPEVLAKNQLPDTFTASPAVAGDRLYLRGWGTLYAVGLK